MPFILEDVISWLDEDLAKYAKTLSEGELEEDYDLTTRETKYEEDYPDAFQEIFIEHHLTFHYIIDLDERGEFRAHVEDYNENEIFNIEGFDIFEDGYMKHSEDVEGLEKYLKELKIIPDLDEVTIEEE